MEKFKFVNITADMSCKEIFQQIDKRQIFAIMFHAEMADYFEFLGLAGYKRMHEFQHLEESAGNRWLHKYFISANNELLPESQVESPKAIPSDWFNVSRFDLDRRMKQRAVREAFQTYAQWENETKQFYSECSQALHDLGKTADGLFVDRMIMDVSEELVKLEEEIVNLIGVEYDPLFVANEQRHVYEKYKGKIKEDLCINMY